MSLVEEEKLPPLFRQCPFQSLAFDGHLVQPFEQMIELVGLARKMLRVLGVHLMKTMRKPVNLSHI